MRSTVLPGSPRSTNIVSHMLRAGCSGGMFSAVKLFQSVSTSGTFAHGEPEAHEHVLEMHVRLGDEMQVAALRTGEHLGEVEPFRGDALRTGPSGNLGAALLDRRGHSRGGLVQRLARRPPPLLVEATEAALERAEL